MCMYFSINAVFMIVHTNANLVLFYYLPYYFYFVSLYFTATYADARVKLHQAEYSQDLTDTDVGSRKKEVGVFGG